VVYRLWRSGRPCSLSLVSSTLLASRSTASLRQARNSRGQTRPTTTTLALLHHPRAHHHYHRRSSLPRPPGLPGDLPKCRRTERRRGSESSIRPRSRWYRYLPYRLTTSVRMALSENAATSRKIYRVSIVSAAVPHAH